MKFGDEFLVIYRLQNKTC